MKFNKIFLSVNLFLGCFTALMIGNANIHAVKNNQEVRTVSYAEKELNDDRVFDEFDDHSVLSNEDGIFISAKKTFDSSVLSELDLVSLDDSTDSFTIIYEVDYVEQKDTVFLTATLEDEENTSIIETIPGLASINSKGEADILFVVDGEQIWLSDLTDSSVINNTGWFKNLIKKITNTAVTVASTVVKALAPIIHWATEISYSLAVTLLGNENAAKYGAKILNMEADTAGIYHASFDCWQANFGYTNFYDAVFDAATSMKPAFYDFDINIDENGKGDGYTDYAIWAWKGNYLNLGAGAELGIYERWEYSDLIWKVNKNLAMKMTLKLEHKDFGTLIDWRPGAKQWWITGFDYKTQGVDRSDLTATFTFTFNDSKFYDCLKHAWGSDSQLSFDNGKTVTLTF